LDFWHQNKPKNCIFSPPKSFCKQKFFFQNAWKEERGKRFQRSSHITSLDTSNYDCTVRLPTSSSQPFAFCFPSRLWFSKIMPGFSHLSHCIDFSLFISFFICLYRCRSKSQKITTNEIMLLFLWVQIACVNFNSPTRFSGDWFNLNRKFCNKFSPLSKTLRRSSLMILSVRSATLQETTLYRLKGL